MGNGVGEVIGVCGGIASGKTTLCKQIERAGANVIYENFEDNQFWEKFYSEPVIYAFETEISFLLQHCAEIKSGRVFKSVICDFSILQDIAYADVNLHGKRHHIFCALADELMLEVGQPTHLIYLTCPAEVLQKRIEQRNREAEREISLDYLVRLNNALEKRVKDVSRMTSVITVDSNRIDFRYGIEALPEVVSLVKEGAWR
ncbi:deoxynucleoside kinase [Desulfovibrio sp. QI0434]